MKALLPFCSIILISCAPNGSSDLDDICSTSAHKSYSGVALALATGTATFAFENPYCPFVLTGPNSLRDEVFVQWTNSPYQGDIRPIYISIEGEILSEAEAGKVPYFRAQTIHEISVDFSQEQARRAFDLRMAMPIPERRIGPAKSDPDERARLTD